MPISRLLMSGARNHGLCSRAIGPRFGNPDMRSSPYRGTTADEYPGTGNSVLEELPIISCIFNNNIMVWCVSGRNSSMESAIRGLRSGAACRGKCGEVECPTYTPDFMKLAESYGAKESG